VPLRQAIVVLLFFAVAAPAQAARVWQEPQRVNAADTDSWTGDLAVTGFGDRVLAWMDHGADGYRQRVAVAETQGGLGAPLELGSGPAFPIT
jgi:hypothetical protein